MSNRATSRRGAFFSSLRRYQPGDWWIMCMTTPTGQQVYLSGPEKSSGRFIYTQEPDYAAQFRNPSEAGITYWSMGGESPYQCVLHSIGERRD